MAKTFGLLTALGLVLGAFALKAERAIDVIWQPITLTGTEMDATPLGDGDLMRVVLMSRPHFLSSAIYEERVAFICEPHKLAGTDSPKDSNLASLLGVKIAGKSEPPSKWNIEIDLSAVTEQNLEKYGITLPQLCKVLFKCLDLNLLKDGKWISEKGPYHLDWKLPKFANEKDLKNVLPARLESSLQKGEAPSAEQGVKDGKSTEKEKAKDKK